MSLLQKQKLSDSGLDLDRFDVLPDGLPFILYDLTVTGRAAARLVILMIGQRNSDQDQTQQRQTNHLGRTT